MNWMNELQTVKGQRISFDLAWSRLIDHEGGLSMDRDDPGNWTGGAVGRGQLKGTKYGISAASYPDEDIANLTLERAKYLTKRDFWDKASGDELDGAVAFQLFDASYNHGAGNAIRMLQRAVGASDDGQIGPASLAKIHAMTLNDQLLRFNAQRIRFFTKLSTFTKYGRGWMNRVAQNLDFAAEDN